ncbi:MAG TPA: DEAD/DEAH box helicase, partial [Chthoniobacterales bacterium]
MNSVAPPITQKLLANAGGWAAMKQAQQLQAAGRVTGTEYQPPLLSGTVREGNRNLRSGLRIKSESDIENLCTCRESREWGRICAHALAVGLAFIDKSAAPKPEATAKAATPSSPRPQNAAPIFVEIGSEIATPIALHFILPPVFESAWAKQQIMLVTEVELDGKRVMPSVLKAGERFACDTFDLSTIDGAREFFESDQLVASMRLYPREQFLRVLRSLRGHPRVTFGKSARALISPEIRKPPLRLTQRADDSIVIQVELPKNERLLVAGSEAWTLQATRFRSLAEGFPREFHDLAAGPVTYRGDRAQRFLAFDAPRLREWFDLRTEGELPLPDVQLVQPRIVLNVEGSLRELRAELRAQYPDGTHRIEAKELTPEALLIRDPARPKQILMRDAAAERGALERVERLGFAPRGDRLVLARENLVARFFAFEYPRLKTEWQVTLSAPAAKATSELQPLTPKVEVVGSGENWFELRYSLAAPDGQTFSAAELQRLLRSGQTQTKLRNGRTAVFDPEAISDFEEVLRDCEPSQTQPGSYRINRAQSAYLAATADEIGAALVDVRGTLQRLTSARAEEAPPLGALGERLRDYQREGVTWLWRLARSGAGGILADEMGLGKTVQTLAFLLANRSDDPALIACPSSLVTNWRNEAQRFTPELRVLVLEGPERHARFAQIAEANVVLTSYALLQRDAERYQAMQFSTVVLDEGQHIKNPETQNAQAAFALRARHRFVLTGTPIENSVRDL